MKIFKTKRLKPILFYFPPKPISWEITFKPTFGNELANHVGSLVKNVKNKEIMHQIYLLLRQVNLTTTHYRKSNIKLVLDR